MTPNPPARPNDLPSRLWQELTRAPHDRHHEWRTPTVSTEGLNNSGPQARTVVLRHADAQQWLLHVFTDARSPKCAELAAQPLAQLTFWSKRLHWQLRATARATVLTEGPVVHAAWQRLAQSPAAADYTSALAPGSAQSTAHVALAEGDTPAHYLAVVVFQVTGLDWLALSKKGHQRARLSPGGALEWLVP
ncbi:pyridoxamine 5'-phosphate oxidase family protein [Comamonadaceae bacterium M7527]|nr:pyridoxamine 5'-phosphate oxidase family protein [Comamonadaceae bacterium M7527]